LETPGPPRELLAQQLLRVDLDDDLPVEIRPRPEPQVLMARPGIAVVADDSVRDEIPGTGGDVVKGECDSEWFNGSHPKPGVVLEHQALNVSLPTDGRIDGEEETQVLAKAASDSDNLERPLPLALFDHIVEAESIQRIGRFFDDRPVRVA